MDVFTVHGIGGVIGNILNGIFASRQWGEIDGEKIMMSGLVDGEFVIGWQLASCVICFAWSFVITSIILYIIKYIPGINLQLFANDMEAGMDMVEMGETTFDYVKELSKPKPTTRDFGTCTQKPSWGLLRKGSKEDDQ